MIDFVGQRSATTGQGETRLGGGEGEIEKRAVQMFALKAPGCGPIQVLKPAASFQLS
jgi:hypothetical protein